VTTDLASGIRRLVDGGAPPIVLDEVLHREPAGRSSGQRHAILAAVLVVVVALLIALTATLHRGTPGGVAAHGVASTTPFMQIPQGVSVQQFGNRLAFVARNGDHVTVFDTDVQHLRGENYLWWCPNEQLFVAPTHGETFTRSGKAIAGPARAGLNRFRATVQHGELQIYPSRLIPGSKGNAQTPAGQTAGRSIGPWDSGPTSFCVGALKANNARKPETILHVRALIASGYDQKIYTVPEGLTEIRLSGVRGIILNFDDPRYSYCVLGTDPGAMHTCRVSLTPGDYTVGSIPGHRQVGYQATIHVSAPRIPRQSAAPTTTP
jgi:nitrite reductase/ring-hydroxylating ferredoxin subunit